jgi:uncharacterized membrane protein
MFTIDQINDLHSRLGSQRTLPEIGSGIVAGVFFAFSSFVMVALGRISPVQGIAAMNSINVTVINPGFMAAFIGTGVLCLFIGVGALFIWKQAGTGLALMARPGGNCQLQDRQPQPQGSAAPKAED